MPCSTPGAPARESRRVIAGRNAAAAGFDADEPHARVVDERVEQAHRVAAAADAGDDDVRQPPGAARICARASWPITDWNSRTISGYGCGPSTDPSR